MDWTTATPNELRAAAETAPRQLSICYTQMAHAREALDAGNAYLARAHYEAAKRAFLRAQEDERGQVMRAEATQRVVEERGAAQSAEGAGKVVARSRALAAYTFKWHDDARDR